MNTLIIICNASNHKLLTDATSRPICLLGVQLFNRYKQPLKKWAISRIIFYNRAIYTCTARLIQLFESQLTEGMPATDTLVIRALALPSCDAQHACSLQNYPFRYKFSPPPETTKTFPQGVAPSSPRTSSPERLYFAPFFVYLLVMRYKRTRRGFLGQG